MPDVVVIGGGPAGAAAAIRLAEAGREVLVFERTEAAHHKVCGEFLSVEALGALARLGLDPAALGAAPIDRVRVTAGVRTVAAPLPFPAAGLSRRTLDAALLARAAEAGAKVRRGARVRGIAAGRVEVEGGDAVAAPVLLLATGKHDLRGHGRSTRWRGRSDMLGLKMHLRLPPGRVERTVELQLFAGGCAGIQPVDGAANLCISVSGRAYACAGGKLESLLAAIARANPSFAETIAGAKLLWPKPLAIARVPYGHLHRPGPEASASIWRLGDQAAVTPSFTGDGLAIALESGLLAADTIVERGHHRDFEERLYRRASRQVRAARALQALVDRPALHEAALAVVSRAPALLAAGARATRLGPGSSLGQFRWNMAPWS
jgi:menaquinone-9 beta-reductase